MIENFDEDGERSGYISCRSTGCSCCSNDFDAHRQKKGILESLRDNVRVAKKVCEYYKLDFAKFCSDILTEQQCNGHHKWYQKYEDDISKDKSCWKCEKMKNKVD